ncbi:MAG: HAMP domain-containing histidine kinase [Chloroflexi bacterium]|nr:HAMP domain-containing histidine kinase [Chloroflexota bacterium]
MTHDAATHDTTQPAEGGGTFFQELDTQLLVHELKSPLALVEATTRTLLASPSRHGPLTERQEKALRRILRGALRGRRLVEHLLEVGRAEASQFTYASFAPAEAVLHIVLAAVESFDDALAGHVYDGSTDAERLASLAAAGIHVHAGPGVGSLTIHQDPVKFDLMVGNLVQNALHYRRQTLDVTLEQAGGMLTVQVQDDGPGIAPEHHATVFERYRQVAASDGLERKGHGLGLAGARILARRLGGDITLSSEVGRGTTFCLTVPTGRRR